MNILLAVDGSDYTKRMLAYLTTHDDLFTPQQQFTLFTAQPLIPLRARAALGKEVVAQYHREEAEKIWRQRPSFWCVTAWTPRATGKPVMPGKPLPNLHSLASLIW